MQKNNVTPTWAILAVRPDSPTAVCPRCPQPSAHVHQYDLRLVCDLP
ncbi:MAG: hypothetical protein M3Z04_07850 [Chloroflexota bacterium]|nr:hypothetical protein [Chloroflexota bacterium]